MRVSILVGIGLLLGVSVMVLGLSFMPLLQQEATADHSSKTTFRLEKEEKNNCSGVAVCTNTDAAANSLARDQLQTMSVIVIHH
jgi:hypothetical protein